MYGFHILLILFIAVPLTEIFVLIEVGSAIGALPTIALCIATAFIGATLIRAQGLTTLAKVQSSLQREEVPAIAMMEGAFLLVAGMCLLTPGLITDVIGFLCLVPPLRMVLIEKAFIQRVQVHSGHTGYPGNTPPGGGGQFPPAGGASAPRRDGASRSRPRSGGEVIDGEYQREDDGPRP